MADAQALSAVDQLVGSPGWRLVRERYEEMFQAKLRFLRTSLDTGDTEHTRGFLAGVEACLTVPGILQQELR